jgi:hypothetical protein
MHRTSQSKSDAAYKHAPATQGRRAWYSRDMLQHDAARSATARVHTCTVQVTQHVQTQFLQSGAGSAEFLRFFYAKCWIERCANERATLSSCEEALPIVRIRYGLHDLPPESQLFSNSARSRSERYEQSFRRWASYYEAVIHIP